ncbi:MAG TPA: hypothetical protein VIS56_00205 [Candidatus Saccharimonadales bacterium]
MPLRFSKNNPIVWLYAGGILLLAAGALLWCFKVSMSPERVFWKTIERSLATSGVTVQAEQNSDGTESREMVQYSLGGTNRSHSLTTMSQQGTTIVNETIGTPTADYVRYKSINTNQKKADGSLIDFSKAVGVWAKGTEGSGQFFSQAALGVTGVLIAGVPSEARAGLVQQVRDDFVYRIDFSKTKKERIDGRLVYTYEASVQPFAYAKLLKQFAKVVGLQGLEQLDPEEYKGQKPLNLLISVDARAHQVASLSAPGSASKQTFSAHDIPVRVELPEQTITGAELQKRINSLQ